MRKLCPTVTTPITGQQIYLFRQSQITTTFTILRQTLCIHFKGGFPTFWLTRPDAGVVQSLLLLVISLCIEDLPDLTLKLFSFIENIESILQISLWIESVSLCHALAVPPANWFY